MSSLKDSLPQLVQGVKSPSEFNLALALALGLVANSDPEVKFGHCPDAGVIETDVWELGKTIPEYVFPDLAGEVVNIRSTLADTQTIMVNGLDEFGIEKDVPVVLTGTTPVVLSGLWQAVNRAYNISNTRLLGDVIIDGNVSGNTFAFINHREQQTTQSIYMSPSDKYAVVLNISSSMNNSTNQDASAIVKMQVAEPNQVFRTKLIYGLQKRGTSNISTDLVVSGTFPPSTRIKISITPDSADMDVSAEFSMVLVDKESVKI